MKTLRVPVLLSVFALLLAPGAANATGTLDQQQTTAEVGFALGGPGLGSTDSLAQTFTAGLSGGLDHVELFLARSNATLPLKVEIRTVEAGGAPSATVLASENVPASSIPEGRTFVPVAFASPAAVVAGTQYAIVAYTTEPLAGFEWWGAFGNPYAAGAGWTSNTAPPTIWNEKPSGFPVDFAFKTYVTTIVPKHPTATSVTCSPNMVAVGEQTTCTATVKDTSTTKTTPTGTVSFTNTNTGTFLPASCLLKETFPGIAACSVKYAPLMTGSHEITASYGGDLTHEMSKGSTVLNATTAKCESGDSDDHHRGDDNDQADRSGAKSQFALSGFSQPLLNSVQSDECDNDQRDGDSDHDRRGSDGD